MPKKYTPYKDGLYKAKMLMRLKADMTFKNVFRYDLTRAFIKSIEQTVKPDRRFAQNRQIIMSISGETGTGKTMISMTLGLKHFPNFSHRNMFFYDQQILDNVNNFPENTLLVRDENPQPAIYGVGSRRIASQVGVLSEVSRKAGLNLAFIEPSFQPNPVTKIYIETVDMDLDQRITRIALKDAYTMRYMGAAYIKIIDEDNKEWIEYNRRKDMFIESMKQGQLSEAKADYDKIVDMLYKELDESYKTKQERKIFIMQKYPSLTASEIRILHILLERKIRQEGW